MENAQARARFAAGPPVRVARSIFGVAVKAGASKPDISTPEAFKAAMLKAKSVAVLPGSAAGAYITKLFERLASPPRWTPSRSSRPPAGVPQTVAKGDAELGLFLANVLTAPGVELAGPFPGELQYELAFTAALSTTTKEPAAAQTFIDFLQSPAAQATFTAKGLKAG